MNIPSLYNEFIKKVDSEEVFLYERHNNAQLFIEFRKNYGSILKKEDSELLIEYLRDDIKKWFVPSILRVLDKFSEKLLHQLIKTAVHTEDPSFNNNFIEPCCRVFDGIKVNQILIRYLKEGNYLEKLGAIRAFYWTRANIVTIAKGENFEKQETFGTIYKWVNDANRYDFKYYTKDIGWRYFKMNGIYFESYIEEVNKMYYERQESLLDEFDNNSDPEIRYNIALELPKTTEEFQNGLKEKAGQYFYKKKLYTVPDNYRNFEQLKSIKSQFLRKIVYQYQKIKDKYDNRRGLITLKRK